MGESSRRKKLLGQEYGQAGQWEAKLLSLVGRSWGASNSQERAIATEGLAGTLSIVGPFRNLKDTGVKKGQIGLQQIASAIVGCELKLGGRYRDQDFAVEGVGFVFAEQPQDNLTLKSMWMGSDDSVTLDPELVEMLQDAESVLFQAIAAAVCEVVAGQS
jgi:hypothetical protein